MESAIVTAMAATLGSLVGASASLATTLLTQRTQRIRANTEWRLRERQSLYEAFITEASRMSVDALVRSLEKPDQLIALYGILSRIRLISDDEVLRTAEEACQRIYGPKAATDWLGHTEGFAMLHYWQTTDDDFQRAIAEGTTPTNQGWQKGVQTVTDMKSHEGTTNSQNSLSSLKNAVLSEESSNLTISKWALQDSNL